MDDGGAAGRPRARRVLEAVALALVALAAWGCGTGSNPATLGDTPSTMPDGSSGPSCATPNTDCPCSSDGAQVACGEVVSRSGDYVTCSEGTRTCMGGSWSVCASQYLTTKSVSVQSGGLHVLNINPAVPCVDAGVVDLCDPAPCMGFVDDPSGLDAGADSGLVINEAGVTLYGTPVPPAVCSGLTLMPSMMPAKDLTITSISTTTGAPSPSTLQFTASLPCYSGTPSFIWDINKYDLAQVSTTGLLTVVSPIAGPVSVSALAGNLTGTVVSNVTVNVVDTTTGPAPAGITNTQFPVTTGAVDPLTVLYPYPNTVFPLGLPSPLIQWSTGGTAASAVKVTLRFPAMGTPIFSWSEIVPELQTAPTPTLAAQPRATIPQLVWNDLQQTVVRNSGATGGDAVFAIQRYKSMPSKLYAEVPTTIHFANGQLKGNVFYNSYGTNLVKNYGNTVNGQLFGAATLQVPVNGTSPTVVVGYTDTGTGAGCRVCHNVSDDGSRILSNSFMTDPAAGSGAGGENTTFTYNPTLATPVLIQGSETLVGSKGSNKFTFAALSPAGSYLFTSASPSSAGGSNGLFTTAGVAIPSATLPASLGAATPAFAHDATHLAFTYYSGNAHPLSNVAFDAKSIAMMDFAAPSTFSNFRVLYTPPSSAAYSAWPAFLPPTEKGIVFQNEITDNGRDWAGTRSTCDGTGACNNIGATAELWWVSTGTPPVAARLANLNGGAYLPRNAATSHGKSSDNPTYYEEVYNYEPAVLPVTIGGYSWVTFTSRRLYGNVATINPYWSDPRFQDISVQPTTKKIWVAAISQSPTPGADPSFPAFYLPGQELLAGNARAYFALSACENPSPTLSAATLCTSALDCCGGSGATPTAVCQLDPAPLANPPTSHCLPTGSVTCSADGAACSGDAQCCNYATGARCASGVCAPAPPIITYAPSPFVVNFTANCQQDAGLGYPAWRLFSWQSSTPVGTSIAFTAQTSIDGVTWGAPVSIGTAAAPPVVTPTWTPAVAGPTAPTVDQALLAAGQRSQTYLKVTATLNPDATKTISPTLTNWRLVYDCLASE